MRLWAHSKLDPLCNCQKHCYGTKGLAIPPESRCEKERVFSEKNGIFSSNGMNCCGWLPTKQHDITVVTNTTIFTADAFQTKITHVLSWLSRCSKHATTHRFQLKFFFSAPTPLCPRVNMIIIIYLVIYLFIRIHNELSLIFTADFCLQVCPSAFQPVDC
jgi:hypothetical protein